MMNILSIGNSFSQDAQRYLHQIARAAEAEILAFNLYIGGCSLSTHYRNMLSEQKAYTLEANGFSTGVKVSLKEVLLARDWDVVTLQQVSHLSPQYETYQPYLNQLAEYVRLCVPKAKIALHQTWGYEEGCARLTEKMGFARHEDMFRALEQAYAQGAKTIGADFVIPCGEVFCALTQRGIGPLHRDSSHASYGTGRYALGLTWFRTLTKESVLNNPFTDFDEDVSSEDRQTVKETVERVCKG